MLKRPENSWVASVSSSPVYFPWGEIPGEISHLIKPIRSRKRIEYDMESFLSSCVDKYCELAKIKRESLKKVNTPFIDEAIADKEWENSIDNKIKEGKLDEKQIIEISNGSDNQYDASVIMATPAKSAKIRNRLAGKEKIVSKAQRKKEWKDRNDKKMAEKAPLRANSPIYPQGY